MLDTNEGRLAAEFQSIILGCPPRIVEFEIESEYGNRMLIKLNFGTRTEELRSKSLQQIK